MIKKKKTKETRVKRMKIKRRKRICWMVISLTSLAVLIFAGLNINNWNKDNKQTKKIQKQIEEVIKVEEVQPSENETIVNEPSKEIDKNNDYWNYIKLPLINVNFDELLKKNSDTVAFLKVNGTNINYPVVQAQDNNYYLNHSYNKNKSDAGWVFLDYRNNINELDQNTIIYAHGRWDTTMFGSLKNVFKNNWYEKTDNYVIHLSTTTYNSLWQIFSVYSIPTETYYLTSSFGTTESYQNFLNTIAGRSKWQFNAEVNTNDKILTLSTCYNDKEKVVLHAKLIKLQNK